MEVVKRVTHVFPGGVFICQFVNGRPISATKYLSDMVGVIFPKEADVICPKDVVTDSSREDVLNLGRAIFKKLRASTLLILDHADTLRHAEAKNEEGALILAALLKEVTSRQDTVVKILATSCGDLAWPGEKVIHL